MYFFSFNNSSNASSYRLKFYLGWTPGIAPGLITHESSTTAAQERKNPPRVTIWTGDRASKTFFSHLPFASESFICDKNNSYNLSSKVRICTRHLDTQRRAATTTLWWSRILRSVIKLPGCTNLVAYTSYSWCASLCCARIISSTQHLSQLTELLVFGGSSWLFHSWSTLLEI